MFLMALDYEGSTVEYQQTLLYINLVFTSIFTTEAVLKLIAFGRRYFTSNWNNFDFFVVISSILEILLSYMASGSIEILRIGPQLARVLRILRVSRILRLLNKYKGLQALIETIIFSLSNLLNVFLLLLLVFFIYAILGVFIFHDIKTGDMINDYINFKDFGSAMLTLVIAITGESWNIMMWDCSRTPPD